MRSAEGLQDLEDLWSSTVLTEVRDGVVEGLELVLSRLEELLLLAPWVRTTRDCSWEDSMLADTSMSKSGSKSVSLAVERVETGLWQGKGCRPFVDIRLSLPSSSI